MIKKYGSQNLLVLPYERAILANDDPPGLQQFSLCSSVVEGCHNVSEANTLHLLHNTVQ